MIISDLHTPFENFEESESTDYWHQDRASYTDQQIGEMPNWIKTMKQQSSTTVQQAYGVVDISSFSRMQQLAYNIIKTHFEDESPEKLSLCLIIIGEAGTGKSYLINAIRHLLQSKYAVTATTGKASFNIRGVKIHSLLKLPIGTRGNKDLTGQSLCQLQESLNGIDYIIVDEYSMLGQTAFGWIDKRCKQATGYHNHVLGRKSFILTGDPGQLLPVGDKPLYHPQPSNAIAEQGYQTYRTFDKVVKLIVNQRVQGASIEQQQFRDLLLRLRVGDSTSTSTTKKISPSDMSGLEPVVFLAKGAKVMLTMNLWPSVGLCNGATGRIIDYIYQVEHQPPHLPVAVIVKFDDYNGPSISDTLHSCVPVCPVAVSAQISEGVHERQKLPLRLAYALMIHKSQGLTLPKAWVDIGKSEKTPGISYVAISRVKTLTSCVIEPMTFERLTSIKSSTNLKYRLSEEKRLHNLAQATCSEFDQT